MPAPAAIRLLGDLIAPPRCATCGAACAPGKPVCQPCAASINAARPGSAMLTGVGPIVWAAPYEGVARELVSALKFRGGLALAAVAATAIAAALPELRGWSVVAVPAAPARRRWRGFDPAESIALALARQQALEVLPVLARADGPRQVGRRRADRLRSPPCVRALGPAPARALLLDDVLTTGATLAACARALRATRCAEVRAAVFARALG
jgi:predicted amidophosphoribosyltransferase